MTKLNTDLITLDQNIANRLASLDQIPSKLSQEFSQKVVGNPPRDTAHRIPTFDLTSSAELPSTAIGDAEFLDSDAVDLTHTAKHQIETESGTIWISGNTLLCTCPDCTAPMTIRIWLRLADCWRCDSSISLTEEQYQAARELQRNAEHNSEYKAELNSEYKAESKAPEIPKPARRELPAPPPPPINQAFQAFVPDDVESAPTVTARERELESLSRGSSFAKWIRGGFKLTPAWLVSFILHLIIILILALIVLSDGSILPSSITLSTFLSNEDTEGGDIRMEDPNNALKDDLLRSSDMEQGDAELRKVLQKANQDAREIQVDSDPRVPLPSLKNVKQNITTKQGKIMSFAARDPRVRAEMVRKQGGTTITEAAVARGLRWLASVQNQNGGWSLRDYRFHNRESNDSDIMGTSLALLPLLGAGQTHEFGRYKENVASGLAWMINNQKANGDLRAGYKGQAGMYAHGQGAIVLCEALALTGDQKLREPAQKAIRFIELAQHSRGGWRYNPGQVGDTSVFGWQMMALQSARAPDLDLELDDSTLKLADYFLDQVSVEARKDNRRRTKLPKGAAYAYQPGREATAAMTAEAILCRMYLGWKKDDPRLSTSVDWLIDDHFPNERDPNLYYWYYGTQVMHHYGGQPWEKWNDKMRGLLISTQETRGKYPGSWNPAEFEWGSKGGRIYTTSLAVCTLEVYYRHLPLFKQIDLDE